MTSIDYVCRLAVLVPWFCLGVLGSLALAVLGTPALIAVLPSAAGLVLGCYAPRGPF